LGYALAARIPEVKNGDAEERKVRQDISRMWELISFLKRWMPENPGLPVGEMRTFISVLLCDRIAETKREIGDELGFNEWNEDMKNIEKAA
jgi:hypothetical protein